MREWGTILPMPACFRPLLLLVLALVAGPGLPTAFAQSAEDEYQPRTGDATHGHTRVESFEQINA